MCLGIPGKVVEVRRFEGLDVVEGRVDFGGVLREVNLSFTPEVDEGQYVLVHVGFSLSVIDEEEAAATLDYLRQLGEVMEGETPPPSVTS
jgi:hydrogenase expression/formation protein HypC